MFDRWIFTEPPPPADARIAYGRGPHRFGELRLPRERPAQGPIPTWIVIHGGYWLAEFGLEHVTHACADLATRGIATWCVEFRRLGNLGGGWPGLFRDVAAAADHLRVIAPEYGLDLDRLGALGHSAGGHLALWLASRAQLEPDSPLYRPDPIALHKVVALAALSDLREASARALSGNVVEQLLAGSPAHRPERYAAVSPAERLPLGVEQVLVHGEADRLVPVELSTSYAERARSAGDRVTLELLPDTDHFELVDPKAPQWARVLSCLH